MRKTIIFCTTIFLLALLSPSVRAADLGNGKFEAAVTYNSVLFYTQKADDGLYHFYSRSATGTVKQLNLPSYQQPPYIDAGTDKNGNAMLVYSWLAGNGVYYLNVYNPQNDTSLSPNHTHQAKMTESIPTLSHGVLGFWRRPAGKMSGGTYRLLTLNSTRVSRNVKTLSSTQSVTGADLSVTRGLALTTSQPAAGEGVQLTMELKSPNKHFRTLRRAASGSLSTVYFAPPSWSGSFLYWGYGRRDDTPKRALYRARVSNAGSSSLSIANPLSKPAAAYRDIYAFAADDKKTSSDAWVLTTPADNPEFVTSLFSTPPSSIHFHTVP